MQIKITDEEIRKKADEFFKSKKGHAFLKAQGVRYKISEEEVKKAAADLKSRLTSAFIAQQNAQNNPHFDDKKVRIRVVKRKNAGVAVKITYPKETLYRPSLLKRYGDGFTGEGIYDIFALFTTGYKLKHGRPYGYWWDNSMGGTKEYYRSKSDYGVVAAPLEKKGSPFITETIEKFKLDYPWIEVTYPDEWKSGDI